MSDAVTIAPIRPDVRPIGRPGETGAEQQAPVKLLPQPPFVPYPPIGRLGTIGDRRTAATIAADGTIGWWCLPNFDGAAVFGALLDTRRGGYCRLGPRGLVSGQQRYVTDTAVLQTGWDGPGYRLELTDFMPWPQTDRPAELACRRTIIRRLCCHAGRAACRTAFVLRPDFAATRRDVAGRYPIGHGAAAVAVWCSRETEADPEFELSAGEEVWLVFDSGGRAADWSVARARRLLEETIEYWRSWSGQLHCRGPRAERIRQSGLLVHLLSFAPTGAPVAAPTASLPERIAGKRNFDYRFSWIRDASLAISLLSELGCTGDERRYLDWVANLPPGKNMPLQTAYRVDGGTEAPPRRRRELNGYREARPVEFGNAAIKMKEIGSVGYLADAIWIYLREGGEWEEAYWTLLRRIADFAAADWDDRGTGIWELKPRHYVTTRLLCWTALDRAVRIAERLGRADAPIAAWRREMELLRNDIMQRGWCERMGSFRQHYEADTIDAALLLIPLMNFLPPDHPKVVSTVAQIGSRLSIDGHLYRFVEEKFPGQGDQPLGEEEGSFAMCTCWLAHYYVMRGELKKADEILRRLEAVSFNGTYAESIDARSGAMLGNTPLLFTQAEYAKAALALENAGTAG